MVPVELEGNNLGERHKHFNKLVKDAIAGNLSYIEFNVNESDVSNLIKIDVANANRNVEYIVKTLTSDDLLYVNRALKKCDWLICDDQYSHIINPEYLNVNLYPKMQTKAMIKLKKIIHTKLRNESRAEDFYNYETKSRDKMKWLLKCSIGFIENNFTKHVNEIDKFYLKRLCERSIIFLEKYIKTLSYVETKDFEETLFLLHVDIEKYLDIVESQSLYEYPKFGKRATKVLMTKCPNRIIDNFDKYCNNIDTPTFVKYFKQEDLETFLVKKIVSEDKENLLNDYFSRVKNWNIFLNALPISRRIEFVNQFFINEESRIHETQLTSHFSSTNDLEKAIKLIRSMQLRTPIYHWCKFLTFELAFSKIKSMIGSETAMDDKDSMVRTLLASAKGNIDNGKCLLQYFQDKHINSSKTIRINFLVDFISYFNTHSLDKDSWKILESIIESLDIYNDKTINNIIIECLIVYKVLNNQNVPEEAFKMFKFTSCLKTFQSKLNLKEKEVIFNYLLELISKKVQNIEINEEADFESCVIFINDTLTLLKDWDKNILDYPFVLEKIKQLVSIKQEKAWKVNMSSLYNVHKSWRKHMFEESIILSPNEDACINSLKHGPNLLHVYNNEVELMFTNDEVSLRRLLRKVRIYWPESIYTNWKMVHLNHNQSVGQNAITRGLCILLPEIELRSILEKNAPKDPKVNWDSVQELELGFQRCLAKNMHKARPQPPLEIVLLYAKGDYLQYALPSVLAVYYNMSTVQCEESVLEILNTPVSLQKHGLRLLFNKLSFEKLRKTCDDLWTNTKNLTIRTEIFKISYELLCNEKDESNIIPAWELLEMFIEKLTFLENKAIYELLYKVDNIPQSVQAKFLVKSYIFLKSLIDNNKQEYDKPEWGIRGLAMKCRNVMESIPSEFVADIIAEFVNNSMFFEKDIDFDMIKLITSYLLCSTTEEIQIKKYNDVLEPILIKSFKVCNDQKDSEYYIKKYIEGIIFYLISDFKHFTVEKNMIVPVKLFTMIQNTFEHSLPLSENYVLIRMWQLATNMVTLFEKNQPITWEDTCIKIAPEFGKICKEYLREDTKTYFPRIYILFLKAFEMFYNFFSENVNYEIMKSLIDQGDFIPGYLVALKLTKLLHDEEIIKELCDKIRNHPSVEVKMHYYHMYQNERGASFASA